MNKERVFKWLKRLGFALVVVLLLAGSGRLMQKYLDSQYHGERGVYLQMPAPDSMVLRWQTARPEVGVVYFGLGPDELNSRIIESDESDIHEVRLFGLQPATRYWYRIGSTSSSTSQRPVAWFETAPAAGSSMPVRLWVQGDPGHWAMGTEAVRDAAVAWSEANPRSGRAPFDLWLTTGDNAYRSGKNSEFQSALFEPYAELLRHIPYIPAYGNHDARRWAFFNIFTFPGQGELGGAASGTEHYFSLDYGLLHLIFLDSESEDLDRHEPMYNWLSHDLSSNRQPWTIVVLHHPPYSKGSHDSDSLTDSLGRMVKVRETIVPLLELHNVDLVLSGHSHVYERSQLLACHYGDSNTMQPSMILDSDGEFEKATGKSLSHQGTVYAVVGSSAYADTGPLDHPAMAVSLQTMGSMMIDVEEGELQARFIDAEGLEWDHFTLRKGDSVPARPSGCPSAG